MLARLVKILYASTGAMRGRFGADMTARVAFNFRLVWLVEFTDSVVRIPRSKVFERLVEGTALSNPPPSWVGATANSVYKSSNIIKHVSNGSGAGCLAHRYMYPAALYHRAGSIRTHV